MAMALFRVIYRLLWWPMGSLELRGELVAGAK
jgi:hypothetical protein